MYFINGSYVAKEDATLSVLDLSVLRGFGVFDYLRTYRKKPFHLWDHLLRLRYSAEQLGLQLPYSLEEIEQIIERVLELTNLPESSLKIILTGGVSPDQFTPQKPSLIIFAYPLSAYPTHFYTNGIKVITTPLSRCLPTSKTIQYIPAIVALKKGREQNAQEALYLSPSGKILEATTSNFFGFKNGVLHTCCSDEVLAGITREALLKLLSNYFPISHEAISCQEIPLLEEAFITASNKEIMPVNQIDDYLINWGVVGPKTQKIMAVFRAYTEQDIWPMLNIERYKLLDTESPTLLNSF